MQTYFCELTVQQCAALLASSADIHGCLAVAAM
jgi:hypothetical protein